MKKATLTKLFATALAIALCVPAVLTNPLTSNAATATVSGGQTTPGDSSTDTPSGGDSTDTPDSDDSVSGNKPGDSTDTPGSGDSTDTPGSGDSTDTPGSGDSTDTPGSGDSTDTPGSGDSSDNSGSDNSADNSGSSASANADSGSGAPTSSAITTSTTIVVGNSRVSSSIGGIHTATAVSATVVSTPKENLASAIGLSEADLNAGTNIRSYICDNRDKASRDALQSAAAAAGKTVAGYVNMDLYTITKKGVVTKVMTSSEPVTITFALPARLANTNGSFSIVAIGADGKAVVMDDTDTDPRTLTINTKVFGAFSIVY